MDIEVKKQEGKKLFAGVIIVANPTKEDAKKARKDNLKLVSPDGFNCIPWRLGPKVCGEKYYVEKAIRLGAVKGGEVVETLKAKKPEKSDK